MNLGYPIFTFFQKSICYYASKHGSKVLWGSLVEAKVKNCRFLTDIVLCLHLSKVHSGPMTFQAKDSI